MNPKLCYQVRLGVKNIQLYTTEIGELFFRETPNTLFGPIPELGEKEYSPIKEIMILSHNKKPRSVSLDTANKQQRITLNADSSMEPDQLNELLNDTMDILQDQPQL